MTRTRLQGLLHWRPLSYLVALLFTFLILGLHMLPSMDSMLNENNTRISHGFLKSQIDYHQEIAPFARRPLTSFLIESATSLFGMRSGNAFILVNFLLLFLSGCLLYRLSMKLRATTKQAMTNLVVYFLSFSILFAFFPPVFSYDEPLQYCFVLAALAAFIERKWMTYILFFTLALISRETSMLLIPAMAVFLPGLAESDNFPKQFSGEHLKMGLLVLLPLILYGIYLALFIWKFDQLEATRTEMASRFSCFLENFESTRNTVESWTSLFLALGPFLYLVMAYSKKDASLSKQKKWIGAFMLTVIINTPLVILTAFARETRLFALPLFFIWPVFSQLFGQEIRLLFSVKTLKWRLRLWPRLLLFFVALAGSYWFCFHLYPSLGLGENTFFGEYLFLTNLFILLHWMFQSPIERNT